MTTLTHTVPVPSIGLSDRIAHRIGLALVRWSVSHAEHRAGAHAAALERAQHAALHAGAADDMWTVDFARAMATAQRRI